MWRPLGSQEMMPGLLTQIFSTSGVALSISLGTTTMVNSQTLPMIKNMTTNWNCCKILSKSLKTKPWSSWVPCGFTWLLSSQNRPCTTWWQATSNQIRPTLQPVSQPPLERRPTSSTALLSAIRAPSYPLSSVLLSTWASWTTSHFRLKNKLDWPATQCNPSPTKDTLRPNSTLAMTKQGPTHVNFRTQSPCTPSTHTPTTNTVSTWTSQLQLNLSLQCFRWLQRCPCSWPLWLSVSSDRVKDFYTRLDSSTLGCPAKQNISYANHSLKTQPLFSASYDALLHFCFYQFKIQRFQITY